MGKGYKEVEIGGIPFGGDTPFGSVNSHFFDSGAFGLWTRARKFSKEHGLPIERYYTKAKAPDRFTKRFLKYLDSYAEFIKRYAVGVDLCANVDIIGNAELTWQSQQYLEKEHGLSPVPVVHFKTDVKWLRHYLDLGYELIGLGGLVGAKNPTPWIDRCFHMVCNNPERLPCVKLHGFGLTTFDALLRWPWYSVDSTSWIAAGSFGGVLVPPIVRGEFSFKKQPYVMKVSDDSPTRKKRGQHFHTLAKAERNVIQRWLDHVKVPLGSNGPDGEIIEPGVTNHYGARWMVNIQYFKMLEASLPEWPWPFRIQERKGLWGC